MSENVKRKSGRPHKYLWRSIEVGESFFAQRTSTSICNDARTYHPDKKFKTKTVLIKGVKGCRVWRVA